MNEIVLKVIEKSLENKKIVMDLLREYPENFIQGYFEEFVDKDWIDSDVALAYIDRRPAGTLMFDRSKSEFNWLAVKREVGIAKGSIARRLFEFFCQDVPAGVPVHFFVNTEDSSFLPVPSFTGKSFDSARLLYRSMGLKLDENNIIRDYYGPGAHVYRVEWVPNENNDQSATTT